MAARNAKVDRKAREQLRRYSTAVGEVVWASTYSLGQFEILFCHVQNHTNFAMGRALWHTLSSDRSQLSLLKAATEASDRLPPPMRENILWAVSAAEALGQSRNNAVHSATVVVGKAEAATVRPASMGTKPSRFQAMSGITDLAAHFRTLTQDLLRLGSYVQLLWQHVAGFDLLPPLEDRPSLESQRASPGSKPRSEKHSAPRRGGVS